MAASAGKENKPRNPKKRKASPEKTLAIFVCEKGFWGLVFVGIDVQWRYRFEVYINVSR
jgi:hypothetical protein